MLEHLKANPTATWKLRVSFEVSNSGILHLSGVPKFVFDATSEDSTATTSVSITTAPSKTSPLSFDAVFGINSATEAIPKSIKETVSKRIFAYEKKTEIVRRRADLHNALETVVYAMESDGFPEHLKPYLKGEELATVSSKLLDSKALLEKDEEELMIADYEVALHALQEPEKTARARKSERECISRELSAFMNKLAEHDKFLSDFSARDTVQGNASILEDAKQARANLESIKTQSKSWAESSNSLSLGEDLPLSCDLLRKTLSNLGSTEGGLRTKLDIVIKIAEQREKAEAAKAAAENLKKQDELSSQSHIPEHPVTEEPIAAETGSVEKQEL